MNRALIILGRIAAALPFVAIAAWIIAIIFLTGEAIGRLVMHLILKLLDGLTPAEAIQLAGGLTAPGLF